MVIVGLHVHRSTVLERLTDTTWKADTGSVDLHSTKKSGTFKTGANGPEMFANIGVTFLKINVDHSTVNSERKIKWNGNLCSKIWIHTVHAFLAMLFSFPKNFQKLMLNCYWKLAKIQTRRFKELESAQINFPSVRFFLNKVGESPLGENG